MHISYRYMRPAAVFYARSAGPYTSSCSEAWDQMDAWLYASGARRRVRRAFGVFNDDPRTTAPELIRYDACVPIVSCGELEPGPGIDRRTVPGGACAVYTHIGSYAEAGPLFSSLHSAIIPKRALTVDYERPFMAVYLNDPHSTREMHRRTELCIPVVPIAMAIPTNDDGHEAYDVVAVGRRIAS